MTKRIRLAMALVAIAIAGLASCSGGEAAGTASDTTTEPSVALPASCNNATALFPAAEAITSGDDSCRSWVDLAIGRAVNGTTGSAAVWTQRTERGTALIVGAIHTLGQGWFGAEGTAITEALVNPGELVGVPRLFLWHSDGSGPDTLATPWFQLYNPAVAAERNGNLMRDVLPYEDFYIAVADAQKLDVAMLAPTPDPITSGPAPLYDPAGLTSADPTIAAASADDLVLLLGYPNATGVATAAVGRVLSDAAAIAAVDDLAAWGDPEGAIPYDAEVEIIIAGPAVAGMSGGPVVDRSGLLIGVLVRASDEHDGVQYVRAVRMSYIAEQLDAAFAALSPADQGAIAGYLEQ